MTARLPIIVAASAGLLTAGVPALAQDSPQAAQNAIVGPPQLSNFSLNGTVTRAAPAPTATPTRPQRQPPAQRETPKSSPTPAPAQRTETPAPTKPTPRPEATNVQPEPQQTVHEAAPEQPAASLPVTAAPPPLDAPQAAPAPPSRGVPLLPWIIAGLAAAAAGAWFVFSRRRPRESYAGISSFDLADAPAPVKPRAAAQPVAPEPAPEAPAGVVSTRLRPWLEIEFRPDRAVLDDNRAAVAFEIIVVNSGNVPARDVLLEASLFNAGPMQDQQIQLFFDNPVAKGDRVPVIPPLQRIAVNTAVFMARDQVKPIEIEGRSLFVPMIAFNALYRWGGGEGQTSASYVVGKGTKGEKLAPFRLDLGPRIFRGLEARLHELKVRK